MILSLSNCANVYLSIVKMIKCFVFSICIVVIICYSYILSRYSRIKYVSAIHVMSVVICEMFYRIII